MKLLVESEYGGHRKFTGEVLERMVPAPGEVNLFTRIFLPEPGFRGPTVIYRSPYVTEDPAPERLTGETADLLAAGFAVVLQHCRGCGKSEGECFPYLYERGDSLALHDWIRRQPFYAGELYLAGSSYTASVHLACLDAVGDDVRGAVLCVQDCRRYNILYRNGFYKCGLHGGWVTKMYRKKQLAQKNFTQETFRIMPLTAFAKTVFGEEAPLITEEFRHPDPADPFWRTEPGGADYARALDGLKIPVLFVTAFYDIYAEGVLDMWRSLSAEARQRCALAVTPYAHAFLGGDAPVIPFPGADLRQAWPHYTADWFRSIREKRAPSFVTPGNTTWYAQYEKTWRTAPFLEDGSHELTFFLNGRTLDEKPGTKGRITYTSNPYDPAVFKGGCCNNFGGQQIQDVPDSRYDIISFVSAPFDRELRLQGKGQVRLKVASDCEDTCFYARLSLVNKDNVAYCLRDDIVSLRGQAPGYAPGSEAEVVLNFAPNAVKLVPGERLRLDISSSCWPHFLPHRNRTGNFWELESAAVARNTVFTGESRLILFEEPR